MTEEQEDRGFKFRIWDRLNSKFIYEFDACHKRLAISLNGKVYSGAYDDTLSENDYVIQQYTGIKDCNKVDIYEGDILKHYSKFCTGETISPVVFSKYGYGFVMDTSGCHNTGNYDYFSIQNNWALEGDVIYEVIGNIFETPEISNEDFYHD